MNERQLAALTRQLIKCCGGLEEAARAGRLKKSRLSDCQTPGSGSFLPIDVLVELEAYCGDPIVSRAIAVAAPAPADGKSLLDEVLEAAEEASALQRLVRRRPKDRPLTRKDREEIENEIAQVKAHVRAAEAALERGDA